MQYLYDEKYALYEMHDDQKCAGCAGIYWYRGTNVPTGKKISGSTVIQYCICACMYAGDKQHQHTGNVARALGGALQQLTAHISRGRAKSIKQPNDQTYLRIHVTNY